MIMVAEVRVTALSEEQHADDQREGDEADDHIQRLHRVFLHAGDEHGHTAEDRADEQHDGGERVSVQAVGDDLAHREDGDRDTDEDGQEREDALLELIEDVRDGTDDLLVNTEDQHQSAAGDAGDDVRGTDDEALHDVEEPVKTFVLRSLDSSFFDGSCSFFAHLDSFPFRVVCERYIAHESLLRNYNTLKIIVNASLTVRFNCILPLFVL